MFFQKGLVDMKVTGTWVMAGIILLLVGALVWIITSQPDRKETREYKEGKPDTVTVVKIDTVTVMQKVKEKVFVPVEKIVRYGEDSSRIDTSIVMKDSVKVHFAGTTFPAIDSLSFDISVDVPLREIFRDVTNTIKQTDTLTILKETRIEPAWYETWWFGSLVTAIAALTAIITGR